jgi:PAS domain S-box-containing protein
MKLPQIIYKVDAEGYFVFANDNLSRLLKIEINELYSKSFHVFIRKDHLSIVLAHYNNQIKQKKKSSYLEMPLITNDGEEVWIGQTVEIVSNSSGIQEFMGKAWDITDRVIVEQKYKKIIQNNDLGLMEVNLREEIVYVNDSFCKSMGYLKSELLGKISTDVFVDKRKTLEGEVENQSQRRKKGISSAYEMKLKKKNRGYKWMTISEAPVKDANNNIIGTICIHNDITESKIKEEQAIKLLERLEVSNSELANRQQYLKAINKFAHRLIETIGIDEIVNEITKNVIKQFNFTDCVVYLVNEDRTTLKQVSAYGDKSNMNDIENPIEMKIGNGIVGSVAQMGKAEIVNNTNLDPRYILGNIAGLSELAVPIIADDEVIGVIDSESTKTNFYTEEHLETLQTIANLAAYKIKNAITLDKKSRVDEALLENVQKMRALINSSLDAVITINHEGRVTEWNPQAVDLFLYTEKEVLGKKLSLLIIPDHLRERHDQGMKTFLKTGDGPVLNTRIEVPALNKNGEEFPIELSIVAVKMNKQYFFNAFVRDITLRKKAEKDMKTALEREQELNTLKTKFVTTTSHEFRTPLTTIQTNIELLEYQLKSENLSAPDRFSKNFSRLNSEIQRLTDLMNDILLIGEIDSDKVAIKPELISAITLCEEIIEDLSKSLKLEVIGKVRLSYLDYKVYRHVYSNLISNAIKYSPGAKFPIIILEYLKDCLKFSVQDFGIGIPISEQDQIFNSFYRASNSGNIQGTGLGLSIVKEFVAMQGGIISVESKEGHGSVFTVIQPDTAH